MNLMHRRLVRFLIVFAMLAAAPAQASAGESYAAWSGYSQVTLRGAHELIPCQECGGYAADLDGDGAVDRVEISIQTPSNVLRKFTFASTRTGRPLEPGIYRGATPDDVSGRPQMLLGPVDICYSSSGAGSFEILYAEFDTTGAVPRVVSFWARFELRCNGEIYPFKGEVALNVPDLPRVAHVRPSANAKSLNIYGERIESATSLVVDGLPATFKLDAAGGIKARVSRLSTGRHDVRVGGANGYLSPPFSFTVGDDPPFAKGSFQLDSDPGDLIGNGGTYRFRNKPMALNTMLDIDGYPNEISIGVITAEKSFDVTVTSEKMHAPLAVGEYRDAARHPFEAEGKPGIGISASDRPGCNEILGNFTITSYGLDDRLLARIRWVSLDFDLHCDGNPAGLRGSTRMVGPEPVVILATSYPAASRTLRVRATGLTRDVELWVDGQRLGPTTIEGDVVVLSNVTLGAGQHLIGIYRPDVLRYDFSQPWLVTL